MSEVRHAIYERWGAVDKEKTELEKVLGLFKDQSETFRLKPSDVKNLSNSFESNVRNVLRRTISTNNDLEYEPATRAMSLVLRAGIVDSPWGHTLTFDMVKESVAKLK